MSDLRRHGAAPVAARPRAHHENPQITTATPPPLRKPQDTIGKKEDRAPLRPRSLGPPGGKPPDRKDDPNRINEVFKDPKKFIQMFVRGPRLGKTD